MKHRNSYERNFRDIIREIAPAYNCQLIEIPDVVPIKRDGFIPISRKRPCDDILVTPAGNYLIEAKYQNNKLLPHQKKTMEDVNAINSSFYVVRKKVLKKGIIYSIEQGDFKFTTNDITKIFAFFRDPREIISQEAMLDQLIPEKKKTK